MKKMHSVSVRVHVLLLLMGILIAATLITSASVTNSRQVDDFLKTRTSQASATIAAYVDADLVSRLTETVLTDEYQALRSEAGEAGDEARIEKHLEEKGLLADVMKLQKTLSSHRDLQGAKYVYLISVQKDSGVYLCDPDEPMTIIGKISKNAAEFSDIQTNTHIDPTVSTTEDYGWICSAYDPVINAKGEAVGMVGVDIEMTDIVNARRSFVWAMMGLSATVVVGIMLFAILLLDKTVTRPLHMLSKATDEFADPTVDYSQKKVINLPIKSKDEIGDLYQKTRNMQENLLEYMDNLTRVNSEKEQIQAELNVATQIQADMLPRIFPPFPERSDFDIYATMDPAREVGGDFYDFFLVDDNHICLVIADVSGKGVPAALFMVIAKTLIKNRAQLGESPAEILYNVNMQLCDGNEAELFVTVWLAIIELSTGKGVAANAGHEHPVICRKDGTYELIIYKHSPAVAVIEGMHFREHSFELHTGDSLFVYTDGVPEATDENNELFGTERMLDVLNRDPGAKPEEALTAVKTAIDAFVGNAPQFDDITMLSFHYMGPEKRGTEELTLEATVPNLDDVLNFVNQSLEAAGCPARVQIQIDIAVEEMFVNVASYAYRPGTGTATLRVHADASTRAAGITILDSGVPYDPLAKEDPDITLPAEKRQIGGLGIFMVKKSMDEVRYRRENEKNVFTMVKKW